jgi:hypothetical protein
LEALAASASSRQEYTRTCSHQNGREKLRYSELTERAPSQAGRADAARETEAATAARHAGRASYCSFQLNFRAAPGRGTRGAGLHDERDAFPHAVDVGAAELVGAAEVDLDGGPVIAEFKENRAATDGVDEGAAGGGLEPGGTTCDGECETALDGVEVRSFGEGELELVTEWCAGGRVEKGGSVGLLAGLLQFEALIRRQVGVGVQGSVDRIREEGVEVVMHQPAPLPGEVDKGRGRLREGGGRRRSGRRGLLSGLRTRSIDAATGVDRQSRRSSSGSSG